MAARHSNRTTGQTSTSCKLFGLSRLQALPARQTVSVTGKMRMCGRNLNPLGGSAAAATGGWWMLLGTSILFASKLRAAADLRICSFPRPDTSVARICQKICSLWRKMSRRRPRSPWIAPSVRLKTLPPARQPTRIGRHRRPAFLDRPRLLRIIRPLPMLLRLVEIHKV